MSKAFRLRRATDKVSIVLKSDTPPVWLPPAKLTSDQCRALAFCLLKLANDIEREETDRLQSDLPLLYEERGDLPPEDLDHDQQHTSPARL